MSNMKETIFILATLLLSNTLSLAQNARAEEVKMTFSVSAAPYGFAETGRGIEVDIVREALAVHGHTLIPFFVPPKRILFDFKLGKVDAASKDHAQDISEIKAYQGDTYVYYHDVIFSLQERELSISEPADLEKLRIVAFETAPDHYPQWLGPVKNSVDYSETPDQTLQVAMLHNGRTDMIVADKRIIKYLTGKVRAGGKVQLKQTKITNFAKPWGYRPLFRSRQLRDQFNDGLKQILASGRHQQIIDSYVDE